MQLWNGLIHVRPRPRPLLHGFANVTLYDIGIKPDGQTVVFSSTGASLWCSPAAEPAYFVSQSPLMMFAVSFIALALAVLGAHAQLIMHTPGAGLIECQDPQLSWEGNIGPVQILVFPGGVTAGPPPETLPPVPSGTTTTWLVEVPNGISITFALHDLTTGQTVFSAPALVAANPDGDTSCLGKNPQGDSDAD
ncbi:hypothetical protein EXIGLDRAFT_839047 [Exidia glandulosa HHB12029]|uniref:Uncharacterized protein n=1 Tax=Exidia glandulosa HHB12029 TaxID=1314781 RepID=A0A165FAG8_EXIGL|nr:hypothetical protein EXIGLDRAFT_839047 [Exidia glandulosa HHB12029]